MARSRINNPTQDLIDDSGAVLWSFVRGEQLEFPVTLKFISSTEVQYQYEAVVIEGANVSSQEEPPVGVQPGGTQTTLNIRIPTYRGTWDPPQAYNTEDVVQYGGLYYRKLSEGAEGVINSTPPPSSSRWAETTNNKIYIQFPKTLASTWAVSPLVGSPVYGFFELRVTEPSGSYFQRTWKPVRGMVEILFSPTDIVPDV